MSASRIIIVAVAVIVAIAALFSVIFLAVVPRAESPAGKENSAGNESTKSEKVIDRLKVSITTPLKLVAQDASLVLNLTLENTDSNPRELTFNSGQKYDIRVEDDTGRTVWRWSDGRMFTQMIVTVTLKPGETISFSEEWPLVDSSGIRVSPGNYTVFAKITADAVRDEEVALGVSVKSRK